MYRSHQDDQRWVNNLECDAIRGPVRLVASALRNAAQHVGKKNHLDVSDGILPIEDFVSQIYFHGIPLSEAATYGEESVDELLTILADPSRIQYHENVALTLGMIGSRRAVKPLIAYIRKGTGSTALANTENEGILDADYKGRVGAIMGLGYIINLREGNREAMGFLKRATNPNIWDKLKGVEGLTATDHASKKLKHGDLSKYAVMSLGISGNPEAANFLRQLKQQRESRKTITSSGTALEKSDDDFIRSSLELNDQIWSQGLLNYYASQ